MRIFKNRGDIFFSKTNKKQSFEQKFLITSLVIIVIFTIIFLIVVGAKNDFSAKKFFEPENISTTVSDEDNETVVLPEISGKSNILLIVENDSNLLFAGIYQVDMDNCAYKAAALKASTVCDGQKLSSIYSSSSAQNVENAVELLLDIDIDYYISMKSDKFSQMYSSLGEVTFTSSQAIKFKDNDSNTPYSVKIKEGEQTIKASQFIGLVRYYLDEKNNTSLANELLLSLASQQVNETNYENREELFSQLMSLCETDITVKDYSLAADALTVFSNREDGVKVYSASAEYKKGKITDESIKEIRAYFVK